MAIVALRKVPIRALRSSAVLHPFSNSIGAPSPQLGELSESARWISRNGISTMHSGIQGIIHGNLLPFTQQHLPPWSPMVGASFSSTASKDTGPPTDVVVEFYQKMLKSLEARTMPPNAWLWSLIASCSNREDIKLLFEMLQKLRIFRLSNLRIHDNFNCHLCMRVSEACARASAVDYGLKALWKHNVYGITPTIGSAHYLLSYAKEHNDAKLMVKIMQTLQKNSLPLQPGTADIVFSICYNTNNWDLISKYAKKFIKAGVKLHRAAFDIWMEFAAKVGDAQSIWKIDKMRSKFVKQHTLATGLAYAKGYLLEHNPEGAAAIIQLLYQTLPDQKKPSFTDELQKLVNEWPLDVVKRQKKEDRKALEDSLKSDIPAMINSLLTNGLDVPINVESQRS